jgi:serine/threonine-protein kinase
MTPVPDDSAALPDRLDSYVADLQAGREPDRRLLDEHPEMAPVLDCLDALERLAPDKPLADDVPTLHLGPPEAISPSPPAEGTTFGKYVLLEEVGRGGMGVVYKARQAGLDRVVAVKMILSGALASADQVSRFRAEARAAAGLEHEHIVAVFDADEIHGQPYFAMQYVAGPSLARVLKGGPLSAEQAARCVAGVARAVAHLHAHGVVHRDLKPSNILLDDTGKPYVTDFGLVKMLAGDGHVTSTNAILGTPAYMAPEQAAGRTAEVGPLSDVYSLGAVLYETLTGRAPFQAETQLDLLVQVLESEPVRPRQLNPGVPHALELICLKCLDKDPSQRYASAAALAQDLDHFLMGKDEDIAARHVGVARRLRRWARRQPALASRVAALALILAVIQANFLVFHNVTLRGHLVTVGALLIWGAASWFFQHLLDKGIWPDVTRCAWAGCDLLLFSALLVLNDAFGGPLLVGYPLLVAGAGLWFRPGLVWFTAGLAAACYVVLAAATTPSYPPHVHAIFVVGMLVLGFVTCSQVQRVRALSRYYEHRPLH